MSRGTNVRVQSLPDQITHRAKYMVDLIDRTTHPWSALLLVVHYLCSSVIGRPGCSAVVALYALELSRLLAPGGDPIYFPRKLVDTAVDIFKQLWSGIYESRSRDVTLESSELCNSAIFLVDLYAFGLLDDKRMMASLDWLLDYSGFQSVEQMKCLEVLLERLLAVASLGRSLPFDFVHHKLWPNVVSAWKNFMENLGQKGGDRCTRFSAFAEFHHEVFTGPLRKHRVRLLSVSRILANLSRLATKISGSQLGDVEGKLLFDFDTQVELTCNSNSFKLMEHLMNATSRDVDLDDALEEGSIYLSQMYRMIKKPKL